MGEPTEKCRKRRAGIISLIENTRVDIEIRFEKPFRNIAQTPFVVKSTGDTQTTVIWGMIGRNSYPLNLMTALMTGVLKKDLDESLNNLKAILEK